MDRLQQQLNSLRHKQKVFKLQRMVTGDQGGLIDSGATHPLRPMKSWGACGKLPSGWGSSS